ncbi:uncharacterized protein VTP21DRAFT_1549 [Calcarisporiella thermophila]|uniref:uncharacterized protein n=1 Tax=Calcarisporiella thermophila TaxID=911321 RepID=UPI00374220E1
MLTTPTSLQRLEALRHPYPQPQMEPARTKPRPHPPPAPPPPPPIIRDEKNDVEYTRCELLGEGGFARVYKVIDPKGNPHAAKVVWKKTLRGQKNHSKLFTEIKIHQSLSHRNIVKFLHCFEDDANYYILMELCENKTLMQMLKQRTRFTEPETRYYMLELLDACAYMHRQRVIHRDLKLSNLFLSANMDLRVGDFGLAAMLMSDEERKKTICGTPNYIAPEVLFGKEGGHSYEVDIWSIGVILYTMLVGKPPFQTKDIKHIYKNIRNVNYEFPASVPISNEARNLITQILDVNPENRPSLQDIRKHVFFYTGFTPVSISPSSLHSEPHFSPLPSRGPRLREDMRIPIRDKQGINAKYGSSPSSSSPASQGSWGSGSAKELVQSGKDPNGNSDVRVPERYPLLDLNRKDALDRQVPIKPSSPTSNSTTNHYAPVYYAMDAFLRGKPPSFHLAVSSSHSEVEPPFLLVAKWVDFTHGLGYILTDGVIGVQFRDGSTMALDGSEMWCEYIWGASVSGGAGGAGRARFLTREVPHGLEHKASIVKRIKDYTKNLQSTPSPPSTSHAPSNPQHSIPHLLTWSRAKHAVIFVVSHGFLQLNFFDHTKLVLHPTGRFLYIDRERRMRQGRLVAAGGIGEDVLRRIRYARDVLRDFAL